MLKTTILIKILVQKKQQLCHGAHTKIPAVHDQSSLGKSDQNPSALLQLPIWTKMHKGIRFRAEFWKKIYQSVHQQIKVKYLEEKEEE